MTAQLKVNLKSLYNLIFSDQQMNQEWFAKFKELLGEEKRLQIIELILRKNDKNQSSIEAFARLGCGLIEIEEFDLAEKCFPNELDNLHWWPKTRFASLEFRKGRKKAAEALIEKIYAEDRKALNG